MPELPEVETTKRGITPFLVKQTILCAAVRQPLLRVPVTPDLSTICSDRTLLSISRRAKYLLLHLSKINKPPSKSQQQITAEEPLVQNTREHDAHYSEGYLLIHLGMSGHLRIVNSQTPIGKHDHIDLFFTNGSILRYNDPRRFGLWLYIAENPLQHPLLAHLGPEPLSNEFNGDYLYLAARHKRQCIKSFIMTNKIVVGVGNIYAAEALFLAGIHPETKTDTLSQAQIQRLSEQIKHVLQQAIEAGGTTLRDFYAADGKPGYFSNKLHVYGRQNKPCYTCKTLIKSITIAGRNSAFCPQCQPVTPCSRRIVSS